MRRGILNQSDSTVGGASESDWWLGQQLKRLLVYVKHWMHAILANSLWIAVNILWETLRVVVKMNYAKGSGDMFRWVFVFISTFPRVQCGAERSVNITKRGQVMAAIKALCWVSLWDWWKASKRLREDFVTLFNLQQEFTQWFNPVSPCDVEWGPGH